MSRQSARLKALREADLVGSGLANSGSSLAIASFESVSPSDSPEYVSSSSYLRSHAVHHRVRLQQRLLQDESWKQQTNLRQLLRVISLSLRQWSEVSWLRSQQLWLHSAWTC